MTPRPDAHAPYEELAAGYALSALEPEEEQRFLAHLVGCARCERDVADHAATAAHLAYAPEAADPPPSLLEGIRAGMRSSGREVSFPGDRVVGPAVDVHPGAPTELDDARRRRDASRLRRAGTWTAVAAAAALVVGLGSWNAVLQQDRSEQSAWSDRVASAVRELGEPGTQTVPLRSEDGAVVAVALVQDDEMSLVVDGLKPNAAGTTYVLWAESRYGGVRPVGSFDVSTDQLDVLEGMRVEDGVADVTTFMVSHEQGETAPAMPGSAVLASGEA